LIQWFHSSKTALLLLYAAEGALNRKPLLREGEASMARSIVPFDGIYKPLESE